MTGRSEHCPNCGSIAKATDKYCGVCGAAVSSSESPEAASVGRRGLYVLLAAFGVMSLIVVAIAAIFAVNLLGEPESAANPTPVENGDDGETPDVGGPETSIPETPVGTAPKATSPGFTENGEPEDFPEPAPADDVEPSSVVASSTSAPAPDAGGATITYEPELAADGAFDTAWNVDGDGIGESITLEYDEPVAVGRIGIVPGYDKVDPADDTYRFFQLHVIERAEISFSDGSTVEADFERDPTIQYVDAPETETDSITITILETYPPGPSPSGETYPYTLDKAAISEIEVEGP